MFVFWVRPNVGFRAVTVGVPSTSTLTGSLRALAPCLCHALLDVEHRLYEHFGLFTLYEHYEHYYEQVCGWVAKRTHCLLPPLP